MLLSERSQCFSATYCMIPVTNVFLRYGVSTQVGETTFAKLRGIFWYFLLSCYVNLKLL